MSARVWLVAVGAGGGRGLHTEGGASAGREGEWRGYDLRAPASRTGGSSGRAKPEVAGHHEQVHEKCYSVLAYEPQKSSSYGYLRTSTSS